MNQMPLRYNISSWRQLPQCMSNNSKDLRLHVTDYVHDDVFRGFRISLDHCKYGTLFACVLNARGYMISPSEDFEKLDPLIDDVKYPISTELSTDQILTELRKYGFWINYNHRENLPGGQIEYLMTLQGLHFDKIRVLNVWKSVNGEKQFKIYIVAFKSCAHKYWLNNAYSPSEKEFSEALLKGTATNLTEICQTKNYRWDWLDYVANIDDIIRDNAMDNIYELAWRDVEDDDGN